MVRIDVPRVRGKMAERGYTFKSLAEELEINRNTLAYYLEKPGKTPYNIVTKMAEALCDTNGEAAAIFFAADLRNT